MIPATNKARLGVNIDHIATLRQARGESYPDPFDALSLLKLCHVDQVTIHLREDRRHIQDHDLQRICEEKLLPVNMEMALTQEMIKIAIENHPQTCTLVPEKRQELTTEGGLELKSNLSKLKKVVPFLKEEGIQTSLFIDPDKEQIDFAKDSDVYGIELHTGTYCKAFGSVLEKKELERLKKAARYAASIGLKVFAGHGLNIKNIAAVLQIREIEEYNIGHSIIARSIFIGLENAIREIQTIIDHPPKSDYRLGSI